VLEDYWANAVFSVTPTILVGLIFWFAIRAIFRSDRTERAVYARMEAEERARRGLPLKGADQASTSSSPTSQSSASQIARSVE